LQDRIGGVAAAVGKEDPAGMKRLQLALKDVKQEIASFWPKMRNHSSMLWQLILRISERD
jgi:hypothetical protein